MGEDLDYDKRVLFQVMNRMNSGVFWKDLVKLQIMWRWAWSQRGELKAEAVVKSAEQLRWAWDP